MQLAALLLVTSALVAPPATPAAQQRATVAPSSTTLQPHRLGFGGSLAVSNQGLGASTRYWFSRHVGLSMVAGWYRPRQYGYQSQISGSSTLMAAPSMMVTFNSTDPNREVSVRPYVGVGLSYLHASSGSNQVYLPGTTFSSTTPVGLGGAELFFRDHPSLTLSVDGVYQHLPSLFVNRATVNGLNFQVSAHFYLK